MKIKAEQLKPGDIFYIKGGKFINIGIYEDSLIIGECLQSTEDVSTWYAEHVATEVRKIIVDSLIIPTTRKYSAFSFHEFIEIYEDSSIYRNEEYLFPNIKDL